MLDFPMDITRRIVEMERQIQALQVERKRYEILNVFGPDTIPASQNNYTLEDCDFVFLDPSVSLTLHGISGGVDGRHLHVYNNSNTNTITFPHQSASATAENRIATRTAGSIVLPTRSWGHFMYVNRTGIVTGDSRWMLLYPQA